MSTVSLDKQMHQQLLDMLGAKDQEDAARIIAGFHGAHLSAQAKVRVTDEDVDRAFNASVSVANIATDKRAIRAALESFAARMSQGAQGESTVSETEWVQKLEERVEFLESLLSQGAQGEAAPIPMLLFCPKCGEQHIDAPDDTSENEPYRHPGMWDNPPHRSHLCRACSCIWRPADVATTGVKAISTKGKADNFDPAERAAVPALVASGGNSERYIGLADGSFGVTVRDDSDWREQALFRIAGALLTAAPQPPEGARVVPDGMTLVPSRFVELVHAAHRATHPRAAPQLIADAIEELTALTLAGKGPYQQRVAEWMRQAFIPSLYSNMTERGDRLLEEVLELLQSHGYDPARVATLVQYVFGRPAGEPAQEVGGVMVTLAGYCFIAGLDMHDAGEIELARITQPEVMAKIRAKQEAKNALHFDTPLPGAAPTLAGKEG